MTASWPVVLLALAAGVVVGCILEQCEDGPAVADIVSDGSFEIVAAPEAALEGGLVTLDDEDLIIEYQRDTTAIRVTYRAE